MVSNTLQDNLALDELGRRIKHRPIEPFYPLTPGEKEFNKRIDKFIASKRKGE